MNGFKIILLLLVSFNFVACSSLEFNPRRPLIVEKKWYGTYYSQNKKLINPNSIAEKLKRKTKKKENLEKFESRKNISTALKVLSGVGLGWSLGGGFENTNLLLVSLIFGGSAIYLDQEAQKLLQPYIKSHNRYVYDYDTIQQEKLAKRLKRYTIPIYSYRF
ncbi:MAG: hypothetical protein AB8E15_04085 [Bdellovibrionales bacterium]